MRLALYPNSNSTVSPSRKQAVEIENGLEQSTSSSLNIPRPFTINPDDAVLNQFANSLNEETVWRVGAEGPAGLFGVMTAVYAGAHPSSPCISALLAFVWGICAPFGSPNQRMSVARQKYGDAISKVRVALRSVQSAKRDDVLFAVLLMGIVEVGASMFVYRNSG